MTEQQLALLILEDLNPYPQTITRRALPPTECPKSHFIGHGDLAQLVEHRFCKAEVRGSIPLVSTVRLATPETGPP